MSESRRWARPTCGMCRHCWYVDHLFGYWCVIGDSVRRVNPIQWGCELFEWKDGR